MQDQEIANPAPLRAGRSVRPGAAPAPTAPECEGVKS
jgi:hypothetical protein